MLGTLINFQCAILGCFPEMSSTTPGRNFSKQVSLLCRLERELLKTSGVKFAVPGIPGRGKNAQHMRDGRNGYA